MSGRPLALLTCLMLAACDLYELDCADLAGMLDGPEGLTVTEEEHPTGWGQQECFACHSVERIHVLNCTGVDAVDLAATRDLVDEEGEAACVECHGGNGT